MDSLDSIFGEYEDIEPPVRRRSNWRGGKGHRRQGVASWRGREFIAWDGEGIKVSTPLEVPAHNIPKSVYVDDDGNLFFEYDAEPQPYVLLAHSKGGHISAKNGLSTHDCFEFLLETKQQHKETIFVGFGFNYDVNQMLKDLPEKHLRMLHETNRTYIGGYSIKWLPRKSFYVQHRRSKRSCIIYDVLGFFQRSFQSVCEKYLGEDEDMDLIARGKAARGEFEWSDLDDFIIPYNAAELEKLVRVMDILRKDFADVDIHPSEWHGPGAVANKVLAKYSVPISRLLSKEIVRASQYAFAGGWFEQFYVGRHSGTVHEYDIHSAYPAAATRLPDISQGTWEHVDQFEPGSFGVWYIDYCSPNGDRDNRPQPLFCRAEDGSVSHPRQVEGWYWTPEAELVPAHVREGFIFRPSSTAQPFSFLEAMYEQRRLLQQQASTTERALKLILNSVYGKLAQTVGGKDGPPRWHQLEYAGYITSYTRAMIYRAVQQNPFKIIAIETDAVFSMEELDLPVTEKLGDWEHKEYNEIVYLQSGYYYATKPNGQIVCKYRGMDRDRDTQQPVGLPYRTVLDHLARHTGRGPSSPLHSYTTRFVGLGLGLQTESVWRSWEKKHKRVSLDQDPRSHKRFHLAFDCLWCKDGYTMADAAHPMKIGGYSGRSYARPLPWITEPAPEESDAIAWEEYLEMNQDMKVWSDDMDKWQ